MCGIVGLICKSDYGFSKKQEDVFWQLLKVGELRGDDSTGMVYVEADGGFGIMKEAQAASWANYTMYTDNMLTTSLRDGKVYIGHNRKATVGKVKEDTAHPFVVDNTFAMVHNGTLFGHKTMKDTEVDSEALAYHLKPLLTEEVTDEVLNEKMGEINGAYAIAAYDQTTHCVYLCRNAERPMSLLKLTDGWAWASEGLMLAWIASRNGYDLKTCEGHDVPPHTIVKIDLKTNEISRREYSPKKAMAKATPTKPWQTGTTKASNVGKQSEAPRFQGVSKNEYKRLRRKFIGTRHSFFADDYVEKGFAQGRTIADGETVVKLIGDFDGEVFDGLDASLHVEVDLNEAFGEQSWEEQDIAKRFYHGRIKDLLFNKDAGNVTFILEDVHVYSRASEVRDAVANIIETTKGKWNASTPPTVH